MTVTDDGTDRDGRQLALQELLTTLRRDADARYRHHLAAQISGESAGDSEGVHGWKASREGGADVALLESLDQTVRQIDAALERLNTGAYGRCDACGEGIPIARLRAVPFATRCVPCQSAKEDGGSGRRA
ncbi:MAG TPA: TraR/DksA family transcriptional regulator [Candidatus Polarisedimenticolia bacterium]|nr:TraR/DksA family transcriptional regulator [Candidatus Polarisedimenticolia bacterium]